MQGELLRMYARGQGPTENFRMVCGMLFATFGKCSLLAGNVWKRHQHA